MPVGRIVPFGLLGIIVGLWSKSFEQLNMPAGVKKLAEEHGAEIFFSHDMDAWRGYKHAPDFYEL